jgi:hypothetical protein
MAESIAQSTTIRVPLQAYLASDHLSPATGKTIAITISKNGGAYANPSGATNATEIGNGSYYIDLLAADTNTLGPLFVLGTSSGVDNIVSIYNVGSIATQVWGNILDGGYTAQQLMAVMAAVLAGSASGMNNAPQFKSLDGTKTRVSGSIAGDSRTITSIIAT